MSGLPKPDENGFYDISTAPKDGTPFQAKIPGHGSDNIIAWMDDLIDSEGLDCGGWYFVEDQEPPQCWTDGVCWSVNEDGKASVLPTHWKPLSKSTNTVSAHWDDLSEEVKKREEAMKPDANGWRDIDSAPRDGTQIIGYARFGINGGTRKADIHRNVMRWHPVGCWVTVPSDYPVKATHWHPLPEPPLGGGTE